jgi:hypothetical protein
MSTNTISGFVPNGITLTRAGSYTSPLTITATGQIGNGLLTCAVYSTISNPTLINQGVVDGGFYGVSFTDGGLITNAASASILSAYTAIDIEAARGTVINAGLILTGSFVNFLAADGVYLGQGGAVINSGTINAYTDGIQLESGGSVTNTVRAATISGGDGVVSYQKALTLSNAGEVLGRGVGVLAFAGGTVTNEAAATIYGAVVGVEILGSQADLANAGTISGKEDLGVILNGGGTVTNLGTAASIYGTYSGVLISGFGHVVNDGTISGVKNFGLELPAGGTVTNAGKILSDATAIDLGGSGANRLIVDPGATFTGAVDGSASATNALELASAPSAGKLTGIGSQFSHFNEITIDTGATWSIAGDIAGLAAGETITGFGPHDTITLTGVAFTGTGGSFGTAGEDTYTVATAGTLTIDADGTDYKLLIAGATVGQHNFVLSGDDLVITEQAICFLRGTRILAPTGEIRVEDLAIGDAVVTRFGGVQKIKWIGRQSFAAGGMTREKIPVRIRAGALGESAPARDLYVSPGHSMLVGDTLVLAKALVNGITITQDESPDQIDYFQLDLGRHDCVIAAGTWSETFADGPGLRKEFHNAADYETLYPDEPPPEALALCAPRPERGPGLEAALRPIVARATAGLAPGKLRGNVDAIREEWKLDGWAQDMEHPELPVLLEILLGDDVIGTVLACDFRDDLLKAGIGQGRCSFVFRSPIKLRRELAPTLQVRRLSDGTPLPVSKSIRGNTAPALRLVA